jgi:hypothetical protein
LRRWRHGNVRLLLVKLLQLQDVSRELHRNINNSWGLSLVPNLICIAGAFVAGFGVMHSMVFNQIGGMLALGNGLLPLRKAAAVRAAKSGVHGARPPSLRKIPDRPRTHACGPPQAGSAARAEGLSAVVRRSSNGSSGGSTQRLLGGFQASTLDHIPPLQGYGRQQWGASAVRTATLRQYCASRNAFDRPNELQSCSGLSIMKKR